MRESPFVRRSRLVAAADLKLRQVRAGVFIVAASISFWASTLPKDSSLSSVVSGFAGLAWVLFIASIVVHRGMRKRAQRLEWRRLLEMRLQGLRDLKPSSELEWNYDPGSDEDGRAAKRLIRDLDVLPSAHAASSFASLFPFFLSNAGQTRFIQLLTKPVTELLEVRRRQMAVQFWEKRVVLRRKILRISATLEAALDTISLTQVADAAVAPRDPGKWLALVVVAQFLFFGLWTVAVVVSLKWIATVGLALWLGSYLLVTRRIDLFAAYPRAMLLGKNLRVLRDVSLILSRVSHIPEAELRAFKGDKNPVELLKSIERASGALGVRQNPLLALLLNFLIPWDLYWTIQFDKARRDVVGSLPAWLDGLAELEAFISLAEWNAAHGKSLPQFLESAEAGGGILVEALTLAHPLLPVARRVANDLLVTKSARGHLITGSNMSGKSTFLRAIGLNLLLAHAGAKVTAASCRLVLLRVESSMRPADSLSDGFSSFYSEVSDLVEIVKQAQTKGAVFYMIDEIFRGTNNRERRIGAEAVIRALAKTPAMGFVTTHDLDLATLEGVVTGLENHHFRDDVKDGVMTFSYEYRTGPCPSTNALKVMRTAGLPVPEAMG